MALLVPITAYSSHYPDAIMSPKGREPVFTISVSSARVIPTTVRTSGDVRLHLRADPQLPSQHHEPSFRKWHHGIITPLNLNLRLYTVRRPFILLSGRWQVT